MERKSGKTSLRKNLDMQRMLALKTISRADDTSSAKNQSLSISYLLKPSDSYITPDDSVSMNPSDIFNISDITSNVIDSSQSSSSNINLSQSVQEILAASCLKDVQDSVLELEDISKKCPGDDIWSKSVNFGSMQNSLATNQQSFQDAGFTSFNDDVQQRFLNDEKEWRQEFADIPQEQNKLDFSDFSGYISSNMCNKMKIDDSCKSFGEYFQGGSENLNDMIPVRTPKKERSKPIAIVNIENEDASSSNSFGKQNNSSAGNIGVIKCKKNTLPVKDDTCIASISTISRALNAITENDSPQTIISTMLNKGSRNRKTTEKDVDEFIEILSDNSIISGSIGNKSNKENSNPNIICSASSSTLNSTADFIALTENFATDLEQVIPSIQLTYTSDKGKMGTNNIITGHESKFGTWIKPENRNKLNQYIVADNVNKTTKDTNIHHSNIGASYTDMKFEESVIVIQDDSMNTSLQDLDVTVKVTNLASLPLWCPLYVPLTLCSKSCHPLYINAQFIGLEVDKKKINSNVKDFIKVELPTNSICLKPNKENVLTVKVWGFAEGIMDVTLLLEGFEANSQKKKSLQHTFNINFIRPSLSVSTAGQADIDLIEFGCLPKSSSKVIDLVFTNKSEISLPIKLQLNCIKKGRFSIICNGEDDGLIRQELELELHQTAACDIKFMSGSDNSREVLNYIALLDIGLYINNEFVLLKSCNVTGSEVFSHILFDSESFPLHLEFGETRPATLLNFGEIDLSFDVYIGYDMDSTNPCTDNMFTVSEKSITVKKNEQFSLQVTLNHELLSSAERVLIFKQTLNGPVYHWPLIGKSRLVQNFLKNFISPSGISKKSGKRSASPQNTNNLCQKYEKSPQNKHSPSKLSNLKLSHNKVSPKRDLRTSCGSASTGSEISYGDRLPLKTVKHKMSWPTVDVGKNMLQEVTIKNVSEHRLKINIEISDRSFSLVNNKDISSSMSLLLHGFEVRSFSVMFAPRNIGLHVATLSFTNNNPKARSTIPLVGFGGICDVSMTGVFKLPNGANVLSLGEYNTASSLQETITLYNKGSVPAFAHVLCDNFKSNFLLSEIIVTPDIMVIQPNTFRTIDIRFRPGKQDISQIKGEVLELAKLSLVTGDEGLRQRARQLYLSNPAQKNDSIWKKILPLLTSIEGEPYYVEMKNIKESISALYDLLAPLVFKEISVTVENRTSESLDISAITIDESLMFHSLCIEHEFENESIRQTFSYEPSKIIFSIPFILNSTVKISSNYDSVQNFEVTAHPWFKIIPMSGTILERSSIEISLLYIGGPLRRNQCTSIRILAENDVLNVPIDINVAM